MIKSFDEYVNISEVYFECFAIVQDIDGYYGVIRDKKQDGLRKNNMINNLGEAPRAAIYMGKKDNATAEKIVGNCFTFLVICAVVLTAGFYGTLPVLLKWFGASSVTMPYALSYARIYVLGSIFVLIVLGMNLFITTQGFAKISMMTTVIGAVINIILDPIFIFGFNMGIKGAAVGTVICQLFICAWSTYYFTLGKSNLKLRLKYIRLNKKLLKLIIAIALTPLFMELAAGSIHLVTNKVLKSYGGDLSIGAMTTVTSISLMFLMPIFGLSQGMQTIIAYNHGAKQHKRARKTLFLGIIYGTIVLFIAFMLVQLFPKLFVGIFTKDKTLMNMAVEGIRINLLTLPIVGISVLGAVYFQSVGEAKKSMFLSLLRQVIILIPVILIVPKIYGLKGVWASQPIADFLAMFIVGLFLYKEFKKDKIEEKELSA